MRIFTTWADLEAAEILSASCPDCLPLPKLAHYLQRCAGCDVSKLTKGECDIVARYPLGDFRPMVCDMLLESFDSNIAEPTNSALFSESMHAMLVNLKISEASQHLESRTGAISLSDDLEAILDIENLIPNNRLLPLAQAVAEKADDFRIWNSAIAVVQPDPHFGRSTEADEEPGHGTSGPHISFDQKCEIAEGRLEEEVDWYTSNRVTGLYAKYFEGTRWDTHAKRIWEDSKDWHHDGQWTRPPTQAGCQSGGYSCRGPS